MAKEITTQDIFDLLQDFIQMTSDRFDRLEERMDQLEGRMDSIEKASREHTQAKDLKRGRLTEEETRSRLEEVEAIARQLSQKYGVKHS